MYTNLSIQTDNLLYQLQESLPPHIIHSDGSHNLPDPTNLKRWSIAAISPMPQLIYGTMLTLPTEFAAGKYKGRREYLEGI
jgi:hypothetical protein